MLNANGVGNGGRERDRAMSSGYGAGETILAADIGRTLTKALLLEPIEGEYRLVALGKAASTASEDSDASVVPALAAAIRQIERTTGRRFLGEGPQVDRLVLAGSSTILTAVTSAAPFLPVFIAAVASDVSLRAAREATAGTYSAVTAAVSADGDLRAGLAKRWAGAGLGGLDDLRRELESVSAEVVLLTGGHEGGATAPVERLARTIAEAHPGPDRPTVVYAGCTDAWESIRGILGEANLVLVDNLTPRPGRDNTGPAAVALDDLYRQRMLPRLPGFAGIDDSGGGDRVHSAGAMWSVAGFLAGHHGIPVLGVDIGSASIALGLSGLGPPARRVLAGRGAGAGAVELLSSVGAQAVGKWLQAGVQSAALHEMVARWSGATAGDRNDDARTEIQAALARSALRLLAEAGPAQAMVATGGVFGQMSPEQAALVLLDGLQPAGICQVLLDREQVLPALGGVFSVNAGAAASALLRDGYSHLGLAICPAGVGRPGKRWLRMTARAEGGRTVKADLPFGSLARLAAAPGTRVSLELQPAPGADLGLGPGEAVAMEIVARGLGLFLDCRGRPFEPPSGEDLRKARLAEWQRGMDVPL